MKETPPEASVRQHFLYASIPRLEVSYTLILLLELSLPKSSARDS